MPFLEFLYSSGRRRPAPTAGRAARRKIPPSSATGCLYRDSLLNHGDLNAWCEICDVTNQASQQKPARGGPLAGSTRYRNYARPPWPPIWFESPPVGAGAPGPARRHGGACRRRSPPSGVSQPATGAMLWAKGSCCCAWADRLPRLRSSPATAVPPPGPQSLCPPRTSPGLAPPKWAAWDGEYAGRRRGPRPLSGP